MREVLLALFGATAIGGTMLTAVPVYAATFSEAESLAGAYLFCDGFEKGAGGLKCKVKERSMDVYAPVDFSQAVHDLTVVGLSKQAFCDQIYGNLQGIRFAEGWRINMRSSDDFIVYSCPVDFY